MKPRIRLPEDFIGPFNPETHRTHKAKLTFADRRLRGERFGSVSVMHPVSRLNGSILWACLCNICQSWFIEDVSRLDEYRNMESHISCGCSESVEALPCKITEQHWKGVQRFAKGKRVKFIIDKPYAWGLFMVQGGRCAMSELPLTLDPSERNASLGRIVMQYGFIPGNVQWVHRDVSKMKLNDTNEKIIIISNEITTANADVMSGVYNHG